MFHWSHLQKGLCSNSRIVYRFSLLIYRWWINRTRLHWPSGLRAKKNSSTTRVPMSVDSAAAKGPSTRKELCLSLETWPMTFWQQFPFFRMNGSWLRSILSYRTLTSIICYGGVFCLYMSSYAPLIRIQLWLLFAPMRLGWWSTLLSFLVNGLSPFWSPLGKWLSSGTRNYFFYTKRNLGTKSHSNSWRISSALREAKVNFECHLAPWYGHCPSTAVASLWTA